MNILFVCSSRKWGGNEKWTHMAAHGMAKDHNVVLAYKRRVVGERYAIPSIRLPFLSFFDLFTILQLVRLIRKYKIELVVPTKRKDYILAGIAAKICRCKNVIRLGSVRELGENYFHRIVYGYLADGIIVNAKAIKEALLRSSFMKSEKICVVYNGLDLDTLDESLNGESPELKKYSMTLISMGRLNSNKGYDLLLKAFSSFFEKNKSPDAGVYILGEGDRPGLEDLAKKLHIADRVHFTGFLRNPYPFLKESDVYVQGSRNEGMSNALIEAMYLDCAAVSTFAGGSSEIINHAENGFLFNYGDVKALETILTRLWKDHGEVKRVAFQGRKTVSDHFSLEKMCSDLNEFFKVTVGK